MARRSGCCCPTSPSRPGVPASRPLFPPASLSFLTAEEALATEGPCEADIAFMTREVTGKSS